MRYIQLEVSNLTKQLGAAEDRHQEKIAKLSRDNQNIIQIHQDVLVQQQEQLEALKSENLRMCTRLGKNEI